jgi:hypothetical protein
MLSKHSSKYNGAWIYKAIPMKNSAPIFKGTLKAILIELLLPIYIVESIIFICIFGIRIFPDLIAVFFNLLLFMVICFKFMHKDLPFSKPFGVSESDEKAVTFALLFINLFLWFIHYISLGFVYGLYLYILVLILANIILWKTSFNNVETIP